MDLKLRGFPSRDLELEPFLLHTEVQMTHGVRVAEGHEVEQLDLAEEREGCVTNWSALQASEKLTRRQQRQPTHDRRR